MALLAEFAGRANGRLPLPVVDPRDARHQWLKRLYESRCLLSLRFAHDTATYQSAIIELVPERGYFVLDALVPEDGNAVARAQSPIHLRARLGGMDIRFASRITARGSQDGLPYYQASYPASIEQPQRRREFRVAIPFHRGIPLSLRTTDGTSLRGELRDLSPGGFCARLQSGDLARLATPGARRGDCLIELPDGRLDAAVDICHVAPGRGRSAPRIGACFIDLDPATERRIEHSVANFERERQRAR